MREGIADIVLEEGHEQRVHDGDVESVDASEKDRELLPPEVREQIASSLDKLEERRSELAECLEQRDRLYEQYAAGYARYLKESESE